MGEAGPANLVCNIMLGCGSVYSLEDTRNGWSWRDWRWVHVGYGSMLINAGLGIYNYFAPGIDDAVKLSHGFRDQLFIGAYNCDLYGVVDPGWIRYLHLIPAIIPLTGKEELAAVGMVFNLISNFYFTYKRPSNMRYAAAIVATFTVILHFGKLPIDESILAKDDVETILMTIFAIVSARAVRY